MQSQTETFEQNAQEFWNIHGAFKTLHQINPARLQFIERYFSPAQKSIIDIGCGGGILSEALAQKGAQVSGIDLSPKVLEVAKEHAQEQGLEISYRQISSRDCAAAGEKYDAAVCMEMLEHVSDPASVLQDCAQMLRKGAWLFVSTINRNFCAWAGAILAAEEILRIVPRSTHIYEDFIRPDELLAMAERAGFQAIAISGMTYIPFIGKAFLSQKPTINYLLALQKS